MVSITKEGVRWSMGLPREAGVRGAVQASRSLRCIPRGAYGQQQNGVTTYE